MVRHVKLPAKPPDRFPPALRGLPALARAARRDPHAPLRHPERRRRLRRASRRRDVAVEPRHLRRRRRLLRVRLGAARADGRAEDVVRLLPRPQPGAHGLLAPPRGAWVAEREVRGGDVVERVVRDVAEAVRKLVLERHERRRLAVHPRRDDARAGLALVG